MQRLEKILRGKVGIHRYGIWHLWGLGLIALKPFYTQSSFEKLSALLSVVPFQENFIINYFFFFHLYFTLLPNCFNIIKTEIYRMKYKNINAKLLSISSNYSLLLLQFKQVFLSVVTFTFVNKKIVMCIFNEYKRCLVQNQNRHLNT